MGCLIGEAGQSQAIGALANDGDGVNVTAEIQPWLAVAWRFGFMAQPKVSNPEGSLLDAFSTRQAPVMVSTHQHNVGVQALVEGLKVRPQAFGQPQATMDQIAEDDKARGLPRRAERFQSPKGCLITVAG
tara:strand:- start:2298 stop:2687 length:390 start_codon:yes stop_codon:yes gene_type:complete